jgi:sugar O-acyltransferase (sialic acid O-acetyltransferase NeuD family)
MTDSRAQAHDLVILGGGGHAAVVAESAALAGWRVIGVAASDGGDLGDPDGAGADRVRELVARGAKLHAAVGAADVRARWIGVFKLENFATVIDPAARVSPSAHLEEGCYVGAGAVVNARATLRAGVIVNTRAVVEHDCTVDPCAHIAPAAVLCGSVRVGTCAQVSAGAVVIPARKIGKGAMVGAGAVVVRDVPEGVTAVGVPARW